MAITIRGNYLDDIDVAKGSEVNADFNNVASNYNSHELATNAHGTTGDIVGTTDSQTLTNKTISGATISGSTFSGVITHETVTSASINSTLTLDSADPYAWETYHQRGSGTAGQANDGISYQTFYSNDSAGNKTLYGSIYSSILSPTNGSESGSINISVANGSGSTSSLILNSFAADRLYYYRSYPLTLGFDMTGSTFTTHGKLFVTDYLLSSYDPENMLVLYSAKASSDPVELNIRRSRNLSTLVDGDDIGKINFQGVSNTGIFSYASIIGEATDVNTSEKGKLSFYTADNGINTETFRLSTGEVYLPNLTASNTVNLQVNATTGQLTKPVSSIKYKENVRDLEYNASDVYKLRPVTFNYKSDKREDFGFIAEEVAKLFPLAVVYDKEGKPESVRYDYLSVLLVKAVQELRALIK